MVQNTQASRLTYFFFNDTATTEIYTLSLHDALPISDVQQHLVHQLPREPARDRGGSRGQRQDRKSTRLNSSHLVISYAVFCLKKKKNNRLMILCATTRATPHRLPESKRG